MVPTDGSNYLPIFFFRSASILSRSRSLGRCVGLAFSAGGGALTEFGGRASGAGDTSKSSPQSGQTIRRFFISNTGTEKRETVSATSHSTNRRTWLHSVHRRSIARPPGTGRARVLLPKRIHMSSSARLVILLRGDSAACRNNRWRSQILLQTEGCCRLPDLAEEHATA